MPATRSVLPAPPPALRPTRLTRDQYYELGDRGIFHGQRVERLRGEIIPMSPINWPHSLATGNTADALRISFAGIGWVSEQQPVLLPVTDSDPQPDVAVYPGQRKDFSDHPTATQALLVVEVSDTTLQNDLTVKAEMYAEDGVREFWVLDVTSRQLHVLRDPAPIPAGGHHYRDQRLLNEHDTITPLFAHSATIRVSDLLP